MTRGAGTVRFPCDTDGEVRWHLAQADLKKRGLSKFVADAVSWQLFNLNVKAAQNHSVGESGDEIEAELEETLTPVRANRFSKRV